jgi:UPF0271 protein
VRRLDLNCDLGEGAGQDAVLMPLITSVNIACGAHAGDEATMRATIALAQKQGVAIGAHPGFADRVNFGRREITLSLNEIHSLVLTQTQLLQTLAAQNGGTVRHVKPHGALYNLAARDGAVAQAVAAAVWAADPRLILVGLARSHLITAGQAAGLRVAQEVFADRTYQADGTLTPRNAPGAMHEVTRDAVAQVRQIVSVGTITAVDGTLVPITADTICLHGDGPHAVEFALQLCAALHEIPIELKALSHD